MAASVPGSTDAGAGDGEAASGRAAGEPGCATSPAHGVSGAYCPAGAAGANEMRPGL